MDSEIFFSSTFYEVAAVVIRKRVAKDTGSFWRGSRSVCDTWAIKGQVFSQLDKMLVGMLASLFRVPGFQSWLPTPDSSFLFFFLKIYLFI